MNRWILVASIALSAACSHGSSPDSSSSDTAVSSGGESQSGSSQVSETTLAEPSLAAPQAPIPIPLPGIPRSSLRPELQQLWAGVERALALTPPDPPSSSDENEIAAWASGPFSAWILERVRVTRESESLAAHLTDLSPVERGFAIGLISLAFEDMASVARGAPVPQAIASDPQLLAAYAEAIDRALLPIAQYAAVGYEGCAQIFTTAADPAWEIWPGFCAGHLEDLREVFGRYARPEGSSPTP